MTITITIAPAVESIGIQAIGKALNVTGSDAELKGHLANHLKTTVANLFVRGDQITRDQAAAKSATDAAAAYITVG